MRYGEFKDMSLILAPDLPERDIFIAWLLVQKRVLPSDMFAVYQKMRRQCAASPNIGWFIRRMYSFRAWRAQLKQDLYRWYLACQTAYKLGRGR